MILQLRSPRIIIGKHRIPYWRTLFDIQVEDRTGIEAGSCGQFCGILGINFSLRSRHGVRPRTACLLPKIKWRKSPPNLFQVASLRHPGRTLPLRGSRGKIKTAPAQICFVVEGLHERIARIIETVEPGEETLACVNNGR